eukprot:scaffold282_cov118-Isochrysis_galbana.AAC.1
MKYNSRASGGWRAAQACLAPQASASPRPCCPSIGAETPKYVTSTASSMHLPRSPCPQAIGCLFRFSPCIG